MSKEAKPADLRLKTPDELQDMLLGLRKTQFNLRFQRATGQNEGIGQVRQVRRDIARVKTIMAQKKTAQKSSSAAAQ
jgi:large subunit ribosomal protein L29